MIATSPSAQSIAATSTANIPGASLPGSFSWGNATSCPAARNPSTIAAFHIRSADVNSGAAK
jgi:hypothetical protein